MMQIFKDKKTKAKCHIYQMLKTHAKTKHFSFHTPGHKQSAWDITELSFADNLSSPSGCILQAEEDISALLNSAKSFILTDGSTCGVLSVLHTAKALGVEKIGVCLLSHQSLFNGLALLSLQPVLIPQQTDGVMPLTVTAEQVQCILDEVDAVFLTSPDYYGNIPDLEKISSLCQAKNKLLIIDGAHGGHLHYHKDLYAGHYADLWVDGVHKSLPALTQGAVVSAKTQDLAEKLSEAVKIFRTTSPSYPIMASVEYAIKFPQNTWLEKEVKSFTAYNKRIIVNGDWTKLCVGFDDAFEVNKAFEKEGIYPEFCDGKIILFYLSPATSKRQFKHLKKRLLAYLKTFPYTEENSIRQIPAPLPLKINAEWIPLEKSVGKVCAQACGLFPPCLPFIAVGEVIEREKVQILLSAKNTFGLRDKKIKVVKE